MYIKSFLALFNLLFFTASLLFGQCKEEQLVIGKSICLHSEILLEDRTIYIILPEGYDTSATNFPVLYLPDPEWNLKPTFGTAHYLSNSKRIPHMIIVGIANTNRVRDLTPYCTAQFNGSGGANNFLRFITEELVPYIEKNYKASSKKILSGASLGGVFSLYTLLKKPDSFDAYFAISPSVWYAEGKMLEEWKSFQGDFRPEKQLYITLADEKGMRVDEFVHLLKKKKIPGLKWKFERHLEESHGTIGHKSTFDGLKWIFGNIQ